MAALKQQSTGMRVLTINGDSSSIKFAFFQAEGLRQVLEGKIERIGSPEARFTLSGEQNLSRRIEARDHSEAVKVFVEWLEQEISANPLSAVGHRIVHGGPKCCAPERITPKLLDYLRTLSPFVIRHCLTSKCRS